MGTQSPENGIYAIEKELVTQAFVYASETTPFTMHLTHAAIQNRYCTQNKMTKYTVHTIHGKVMMSWLFGEH